MTDYIVMPRGVPEHYFYRPYEGICKKNRAPSGSWHERTSVISGGKDGFSVYVDKAGDVHLICVNAENKLVYALRKAGLWKQYVLSDLNDEISVSNMRLYSIGGRLNVLYSALYNGENLLIHCILGDHAKPSTVAKLENPHFCIHKSKVYYTNEQGVLGWCDLSDEKPSEFHKLYEDAHYCHVCTFSEREQILYMHDSKLYLNGVRLLYDTRMEYPVCVIGTDRLYVMWKSGSFVRYITSFNGGATWSDVMRFMNTNANLSLYLVQKGDEQISCYGCSGEKDLTVFAKPDIFDNSAEYVVPTESELEKLRSLLDETRLDILDAKRDINRINTVISKLGEQNFVQKEL